MMQPAVEQFLATLARAPRRLLMLDYDGTLAPLTAERGRAEPYPGVLSALAGVSDAGTRLALVSGRPADEVARLLGLAPPPEIWGCHGWERRRPDGVTRPLSLPAAAAHRLATARAHVVAAGATASLEVKSAAVALHWRGRPAPAAAALALLAATVWAPLASPAGALQLRAFDGGCELRALGRDKGDVVRDLLAEETAGVAAAYLGDDETDEDAFRALRGRGLTVLVAAQPRATAAEAGLSPPGEVLAFLARWAAMAGEGRRLS